MRKLAFRGLFAHRLRLLLTLLAVALGVSLISATYVFTDTINRSFSDIFAETTKGIDVAVTPREFISTDDGQTRPTVSPAILAEVRQNPDVQLAQGSVFDQVTLLGKDGKRVAASGAPSFLTSIAQYPRFESLDVVSGRLPRTPDEIALDKATAEKKDFKVGDLMGVQGGAPKKEYRIVGITVLGGVESFGGTAIAAVQLAEAQRMLDKQGFDEVDVAAKPGVSDQQLAASLRESLPDTVVVRTGKEEGEKQSQDVTDSLGFLTTFLLVFGFVSVFVGAFIIFNSFSITIAQRTRELGLLRAIGATRRQLLVNVMTEGLLIGLVGSLIGLGLGLLLAPGLRALFKLVGVDLPSNGLVVEPRTIAVALIVGTVVALLSAIVPAIRATRVSPMSALREADAPTTARVSGRLTAVALILLAAGLALVAVGLFGSGTPNSRLLTLGGGVFACFLGVALLSPRLVRPLASVLGWPVERLARFPGRLARENAMRQPGRTAATAAALMIGVALVTFASVFAAGTQATIKSAVEDNLKGAFIVQNTDGFSSFSPQVLRAVGQVDGVGEVSGVRFSKAKVAQLKGDESVSGVDPVTMPNLFRLQVEDGPQDAVQQLAGGRTVIIKKGFAENENLDVGDPLTLRTPTRRTVQVRVGGIVKDEGGLLANLTLPISTVQREFGEPKDSIGLVGLASGANEDQVQQRLNTLLKTRYPEAEVKTAQEFIDEQSGQVNQLLGLIYALLSLAVLISLFGIVNTLVLSISERTREIGMLRAVGTTRRQVRSIIHWEAVITALIGGLIGCVLGLALSVLFTQPLDGFELRIPVGSLIVLVILAGLAGVVAAAWPARRAAKLDVLEALAYE